MRKHIKNLVSILALFILVSCSKDEPEDIGRFTDVYSEMLIISSNKTLPDSTRKQQIDSLLAAYQYSAEEFKNIANNYAQDHKKWKDIYKEVVEKIEAKKRNK